MRNFKFKHTLKNVKSNTPSLSHCGNFQALHSFSDLYIHLRNIPRVKRIIKLFLLIFSYPSYYGMGNLVTKKIFDFRFLVNLHDLGSGDLKKTQN